MGVAHERSSKRAGNASPLLLSVYPGGRRAQAMKCAAKEICFLWTPVESDTTRSLHTPYPVNLNHVPEDDHHNLPPLTLGEPLERGPSVQSNGAREFGSKTPLPRFTVAQNFSQTVPANQVNQTARYLSISPPEWRRRRSRLREMWFRARLRRPCPPRSRAE